MARWAVFDVDGTLLPHTSTEQEFFKHLLAQQILPPANLGMFLLMSAWYTIRRQPHQLKANKMYLRGFRVNATRRYGKRFFRRFLWPRFSREGIAQLAGHFRFRQALGASHGCKRVDELLMTVNAIIYWSWPHRWKLIFTSRWYLPITTRMPSTWNYLGKWWQ